MAEKRQVARAINTLINQSIAGQMWLATGVVTKVRKADRRVRVNIIPDNIETNWLRIFFPLAGPGYIIGALPEVDTEVLVVFINGDINHAYCIAGGTFYDDDEIPEITDDYDLVIKPKSGGYIKISKSEGIELNTDIKVVVNSPEVHLADESGGKVLTSTTFLPKYNADMATLQLHSNMLAPDPTLATIGNATEAAHAAQKTDAS